MCNFVFLVFFADLVYSKHINKLGFVEVSIMKTGNRPDPNVIHPIKGYDKEIYVKSTIKEGKRRKK